MENHHLVYLKEMLVLINGSSAILLAICIYIPIIIIQFKKSVTLKNKINYFIVHFLTAFMISNLFFPLPVQRALIEQEAYYVQLQTAIPFYELYYVFSRVTNPSLEEVLRILRIYFRTSVMPVLLVGVLLGLIIGLKTKSFKRFLILSVSFSAILEVSKFALCTITGAKYLLITPDNVLYTLIGALIGFLLLKLIRILLRNFDYQSEFFKAFKRALMNDI